MVRRLFTLLSAAALVLFLVTCFLWIHGYLRPEVDQLERYDRLGDRLVLVRIVYASFDRGELVLGTRWYDPNDGTGDPDIWTPTPGWSVLREPADPRLADFVEPNKGLFVRRWQSAVWPIVSFARIGCPFWVIALVLAVASRRSILLLLRKRLAPQNGICRTCGYDLRATPDRCPECGAACKAASPAGESPAAGN